MPIGFLCFIIQFKQKSNVPGFWICEIFVIKSIRSNDSLFRVKMKHSHHKIVSLIIQKLFRNMVLLSKIWDRLMLWKILHRSHKWQLTELRPDLIIRCSQLLEDLVDDFNFLLAVEKWFHFANLEKDTPHAPHIYSDGVLGGTKQ